MLRATGEGKERSKRMLRRAFTVLWGLLRQRVAWFRRQRNGARTATARVVSLSALADTATVLVSVDTGVEQTLVPVVPRRSNGARRRRRRWTVRVLSGDMPSGGGAAAHALASCTLPAALTPADFGLPYAIVHSEQEGAAAAPSRWLYGPDDSVARWTLTDTE